MHPLPLSLPRPLRSAVCAAMRPPALLCGLVFLHGVQHAHADDTSLRLRMTTLLAAAPEGPLPPGHAANATPAWSLTQVGERVLSGQPLMLAAEARARADTERLEQARGALRPSASASAALRRELADSGGVIPFTGMAGSMRLAVPLYRPQADAGIGQALFQESSSRSAYAETRQGILSGMLDAYLAASQADEESSLYAQERDVLLSQRRINERRMEGGVGTVVEVMETAARTDAILSTIEATRATQRAQLAELGRLAWSPIESVQRLRDALPPLVVPQDAAEAYAQALERNSTLARLNATLSASRAAIDVQRTALDPTIDLVGNLDRSRTLLAGASLVPSSGIGVQFAMPLATGGIVPARVREASALADSAQAQLEDATRVLEAELRKGYVDLQRAREQWRIQSGVLATASASLDATRKAFEAGARTNIDLLNSQQLTFTTRRELLRARAGVLSAQVHILALIGALDPAMLARLEAAFEPAAGARP